MGRKKTTTIQKQKAGTGDDTSKMLSSILHSLRHSSMHIKYDKNGQKKTMWDKDKVHLDFLFINGEKKNLSELTDDEKYQIATDMLQPALDDLNGKNIDLELEKNIKEQAEIVRVQKKNLVRHKKTPQARIAKLKDTHISKSTLKEFIDEINESDVKSKHTKIEGIENFAKDNNKLVRLRNKQKDFRITSSYGLLQESFLKFPQLPNGTISPDRHTEILEKYNKENWPDYEIKASFWHGDEVSYNEKMEDCGGHPHCQLSCKNSKTGKYDLIRKQKEKSIEYIKNNLDKFDGIEPDKLKASHNYHKKKDADDNEIILTPKQLQENRETKRYVSALGKAHQAMILEFGKKELEKDGIELYRQVYDTDLKKEALAQMEFDRNIPKQDRLGNSHNMELLKEQKELEYLKKQNKKLKQDGFKYEILTSHKKKHLDGLEKNVQSRYKQAMYSFKKDADKYIENNTDELKEMVNFVNNHDNKQHLERKMKQNNLWSPIINRIENSLKDESSLLKKIHKSALLIPGYSNLFEECKPIYFEQYKLIKGENHELDNNQDNDKALDSKLSNLSGDRAGFEGFDLNIGDDDEHGESKSNKGDGIGSVSADDFMRINKENEQDKKKKRNKNNKLKKGK